MTYSGDASMYTSFERMKILFSSLQDNLSKDIFFARMRFELAPSMTNALGLASLCRGLSAEQIELQRNWKDDYQRLLRDGRKIVLYGTGEGGRRVAEFLKADGLDFFCFCGRRAQAFPDGLMGKEVHAPEWLFQHADDAYVIIAAWSYYREIEGILRENHFPENHILRYFEVSFSPDAPDQYFEFPELFPRGTAFVDGGSLNGQDSIAFAEWCHGDYSKIIAFEPDPISFPLCRQRLKDAGLRDAVVLEAGLSDTCGTAAFAANSTGSSFVLSVLERQFHRDKVQEIKTVRLDDIAGDQRVGMIKLDIEGAEYDALHGAERIILRDRPLLAVCVYHRPGDMLAIMDYCKRLVPEYRFLLRHYGWVDQESVLYASVI